MYRQARGLAIAQQREVRNEREVMGSSEEGRGGVELRQWARDTERNSRGERRTQCSHTHGQVSSNQTQKPMATQKPKAVQDQPSAASVRDGQNLAKSTHSKTYNRGVEEEMKGGEVRSRYAQHTLQKTQGFTGHN